MKMIKILICIFCLSTKICLAQYILIPKHSKHSVDIKTLKGKNSAYQALNVNCIEYDRDVAKFIIHFIIFSDSSGLFHKREINVLGKESKLVSLDSLFPIAKTNIFEDQRREISNFEYESDYNKFPIKEKAYKLAIQNNDSIYTIYENFTLAYFYESRSFKQFTIFQSCASLINIQSIEQIMPRVKINEDEIVGIPEIPDVPNHYFSNKLFLEKKNNDGTYHFVKFSTDCRDCIDNENSEFDYNDKIGIVKIWCYLPKGLPKTKKRYIKFE
jgi:hypothetical protein